MTAAAGLFGFGGKEVERTYKKVIKDPMLTTLVAGTGPGTMAYGAEMMKTLTETPPLSSPSPMQTTAGYASEAEKQKRKRRKGYGSTILAGGELGVSAATQRKQILG